MTRKPLERSKTGKLADQIRAYYDSMPYAEFDENEAWGKFAESELLESQA